MNIVICPGSAENQKFKRWDISKFVKLSLKLNSSKHRLKIVLGPDEHYLNKYFKDLENDLEIHICPSLSELKEISLSTDLAICNDSFLLHFFCFREIKVLGIYGPTDPERTMPPNVFKISSPKPSKYMPCWGSENYGICDNGRCSCFDNLEVIDVYNEIKKILNMIL